MKKNIRTETDSSAVNWHALTGKQAMEKLECAESGLTSEQVKQRIEKYGTNNLPLKKPTPLIIVFLKQFLSPLIYVLLAASVVSAAVGDLKDASFILFVILINAVIGTQQEYKAEQSAAALQGMIKVKAFVKRDGAKQEIDSAELVPGDIVYLESGSKVPADIRLLEANNLEIDEAFLTGESMAAEKNTQPLDEKTDVSDRTNCAFAGASVTKGRGTGVVILTGLNTEVGKIAETVTGEAGSKPPLIIRMEKFSTQISIIVLISAAAVAGILLAGGNPARDVFFLAVALAVSAIPEGLPVALTVALSVATQRMSKRNVIVRKLTAVESLGSCTYIASDKTGTLTVNQQTVKELIFPSGNSVNVSGEGYNDTGSLTDADNKEFILKEGSPESMLVISGMLCNEASLVKKGGKWINYGDAMDIAFISLGLKAGYLHEELKTKYPSVGEIPYESEKKYAAVFYKDAGNLKTAVKGAVETVVDFCSYVYDSGGNKAPIDKKNIEEKALMLASKGYRVLAVAGGGTSGANEAALSELILYGLVGFIDPLRPEAKAAVNKCRDAGIEVAMVTGDHPVTAFAIAKELGICKEEKEVVTGARLEALGDPEGEPFMKAVLSSHVFARVAPMQKLQIVGALIKSGHYVAVTGDGVNDAPALKKANIGVAMGSGTDVAKDTGAMIVTDDNFASIVAGVEEGRFAFDNVRKVIYLLISTGAAEIMLFILALIFTANFFKEGIQPPLLAIQLLWLNLVTNGIQGAALAFEGGEEGAMKKKPRNPKEGIFNPLMMQQTILSGVVMAVLAFGVWYYFLSAGFDVDSARNMTLLLMVLLENAHVFNCRSESVSVFKVKLSKNYLLVAGVIAAQGLHIISMQIPFMQDLLKIKPIDFKGWIMVAALSLAMIVTMEIFKLFNKHGKKG
ncbi:MAG: HAD-IC family P-type ATPase [Candidatus Goldbacteria bacterium]|nr:HAD-IC family P-type ATPase [Candidatus Goldiibacteriota bacterium]